MKRRCGFQSAFFNLRVLIGLSIVLACTCLALPGSDSSSASSSTFAKEQQQQDRTSNYGSNSLVPPLFDCSKIHELGIDMQVSLRADAIMIFCGAAQGGQPGEAPSSRAFSKLVQNLTAPTVYGGTDVDLITGDKSFPNVTQTETFTTANPDNPNQIVVGYEDTRDFTAMPPDISGASVSTDGGNTFTRLTTADGRGPFSNTGGSPVILYNKPSGIWFTVWSGGNGCPLSGYKSASPEDPNSWAKFALKPIPKTIANLAGLTITQALRSSGECTFRGTTLVNPTQTSSSLSPVITVLRGTRQSWRALGPPSSATCR